MLALIQISRVIQISFRDPTVSTQSRKHLRHTFPIFLGQIVPFRIIYVVGTRHHSSWDPERPEELEEVVDDLDLEEIKMRRKFKMEFAII